ncbi:erythromycin esterase family protein [Streptomyces sp. NPDC055186]
MACRDTVMAENTLWWHRRTGHRLVLGGHNSHLHTSSSPPVLPLPREAVLRRRLGDGYLAVGPSFGRGTVRAPEQGLQKPPTGTAGGSRRSPPLPARSGTPWTGWDTGTSTRAPRHPPHASGRTRPGPNGRSARTSLRPATGSTC